MWVALLVAAILIAITYAFIFWNRTEPTLPGQEIPAPTMAPPGP